MNKCLLFGEWTKHKKVTNIKKCGMVKTSHSHSHTHTYNQNV